MLEYSHTELRSMAEDSCFGWSKCVFVRLVTWLWHVRPESTITPRCLTFEKNPIIIFPFCHSAGHYSKYCALPKKNPPNIMSEGSRTCRVKSLRPTVHCTVITFCCWGEHGVGDRKMRRRGKRYNKAGCTLAKDQTVERERLLITFLCLWNTLRAAEWGRTVTDWLHCFNYIIDTGGAGRA